MYIYTIYIIHMYNIYIYVYMVFFVNLYVVSDTKVAFFPFIPTINIIYIYIYNLHNLKHQPLHGFRKCLICAPPMGYMGIFEPEGLQSMSKAWTCCG